MRVPIRPRQLAGLATAAACLLALGGCGGEYPNSTFNHHTEFNRQIDGIWDTLLFWGTVVFVITEAVLIYTIVRFRKRPDSPAPRMIHGNTALEITWTLVPVVILALIAVPTVRTIFATQRRAPADALTIEVYGHQWWWEFRYPQYGGFATANEIYIPKGRAVNFVLRTKDVLHSFWVPQLGGKRDLIANRTNQLWMTPDATSPTTVWNGFCTEFCGPSHANMKFRVYAVGADEFASWAQHQQGPAVFGGQAAPGTTVTTSTGALVVQTADTTGTAPAAAPTGYVFPAADVPEYAKPRTPVPAGLTIDDAVLAQGDPERGRQLYSRSACIGCHMIRGNPSSVGVVGPDLTHVGSRYTLAAGLYPNDARHLALWIKNSVKMKPGSLMGVLGKGEWNPMTKSPVDAGGLTDQEIADVVAYLQSLK
jgi:cytochrome c oxidase subunit 2